MSAQIGVKAYWATMDDKPRPATNAWTSDARAPQDQPRIPGGHGRPVTNVGLTFIPDRCQAPTRDGEACTARPLKGTTLCVGHTKQEKMKHGNT